MNRTEHTLVSFLLLLSSLFFPTLVFPTHLRVPHQYRTIQSAINASKPGDTVLVDEGVYFENIKIKKNIILASRFILDRNRSHIEQTIIDGSRSRDFLHSSTVTFYDRTDTTCVLIGFTIRGGSGSYDHAPGDVFSEHWIGGGGIALSTAGARIAYNIIRENVVTSRDSLTFVFGGGIATINASNRKPLPPFFIIEYNTILQNQCTSKYAEAAGIFVGQPGIVRYNVVMQNKVTSQKRSPGGGVYVAFFDEYDIRVDGNYICKNSAGIGGGVLVTSAFVRRGRAIFTNNIIAKNDAFEVGGAVNVAEEAYAIFINNTIVNNRGLASGGGVNVTYGAHATLVNNIIWKNEVDHISLWGNVQAYHNLSDGNMIGENNIQGDPEFLPDDTLYRLSPNSPCIGIGTGALHIMAKDFPLSERDFNNQMRSQPTGSFPDLGAVESPFQQSNVTANILKEQKEFIESNVKLTILFRQTTPVERKKESQQILRAGRMKTTVIVNDSDATIFDDEHPPLSITLPPGRNLLEIEILARNIDSSKGLNVYYHLEGSDPQVRILRRNSSYVYYSYTDLKPGTYQLIIQPQDEAGIIGHTNRISIDISVFPYWYQREWAFILFAFGVLAITFALYRTRVRRILLEQKLLTEHLQTEKLNELNQLKSRFLANVSHELRTPLSLILGPTEHLLSRTNDNEGVEQLGLIKRNAQRLMRMIELLLQYSRLESGTIKLRVSQEDVVPILRRITGYFSSPAAKKQIELRFITEEEHIDGLFDAEKIEHILQNCISNAIKFTPAGGSIEVRVKHDRMNLILTVKDTGEGISPEHLPHVFERFYRIDATHKTEGTGIGLSLSKELVEIHHGTILLESEFGKGTVVTLHIPLSGYAYSEISSQLNGTTVSARQKHEPLSAIVAEQFIETDDRPIILIAEDNEDARIFIRSQLSKQFTILEAVDGEEALNKTKFQIPDLVISDVMMPKKDGRELCKELKQDERTCHIPVILLTALADKEDKIKGLTTGADDYLVKPFDAQELLTRVRNLLENRKILREAFGKTVPLKPGEIPIVSLDDTFLQKALIIINRHISNPEFGVEMFAQEIFLSRTQLHRKLKAITNFSANDFIRHLRMIRAKELLEHNTGTIAEIADSVGITNHSYFAKCFQDQFGILPNEVRKTSQQ
ncbi:MAG: ATP-binding protein [Bacteroidota bacterium]